MESVIAGLSGIRGDRRAAAITRGPEESQSGGRGVCLLVVLGA